ncbi:hypothetical protein [Streptomyces sp. NBC_00846]|uniref:hypothetical protein n=1 Tax=Streptomyces sp. NBC_00846 TaxID=2975849 RepID=UPI00386D33FF
MQQHDRDAAGQQDGSPTGPTPAPTPASASASVHVLLVEDDEAIRRSVGMVLDRYGYQVSAAPDGLTGLRR